MMILGQELVHWKKVGGGGGAAVAAQGMKMPYTKVLIPEVEQERNVAAVMTIFCLPECYLHQVFADQTSLGALHLVPIQLQMNLA